MIRAVSRGALTGPLAVGLVTVAATGYLSVVDPNRPGHYPTCPILLLTGHPCPGCGGLRAVADLTHARFEAAVSANLLLVLAIPVLVLFWARWGLLRAGVTSPESRWNQSVPSGLLWVVVVLVGIFWVLRNLPATAWLAP